MTAGGQCHSFVPRSAVSQSAASPTCSRRSVRTCGALPRGGQPTICGTHRRAPGHRPESCVSTCHLGRRQLCRNASRPASAARWAHRTAGRPGPQRLRPHDGLPNFQTPLRVACGGRGPSAVRWYCPATPARCNHAASRFRLRRRRAWPECHRASQHL